MKIVAITGGRGSGKSHCVRLLQIALGEKASVLSLDNYYKPRYTQLKDENGIDKAQATEGEGAGILGIHGAVRTFQGTHRFVAVDGDGQNVAESGGLHEITQVAFMQDVKAAIR